MDRPTRVHGAFVMLLFVASAGAGTLEDARLKSKDGDWKGAESLYRKAMKGSDDPVPRRELAVVLYNRALVLGRKDDFGATLPLLEEAVELAPDLLDAHIALALSFDKLKRPVDAAATLADIGALYLLSRRPEQALQAFREALARDRQAPYAVGEGDALLQKGDFHGALESYRKAAESAARGPGLHRRMGDAYGGLGLDDQAREQYEQAEQQDDGPEMSLFLARWFSTRKDWQRVVEHIQTAERRGAKRAGDVSFLLANAHYNRAVTLLAAHDQVAGAQALTQAIAISDEAIARKPVAELYQIKGMALLMLKKPADAARALESALPLVSAEATPIVNRALAVAYEQAGETDKAAAARERAGTP